MFLLEFGQGSLDVKQVFRAYLDDNRYTLEYQSLGFTVLCYSDLKPLYQKNILYRIEAGRLLNEKLGGL